MSARVANSIWERLIQPDNGTFSPEAARYFLALRFGAADAARMNELSAKAREGSLSPKESAELDEYLDVGNVLAIVQSKARQSLKKANLTQ